jgi:MoxR-like ATPase
VRRVDSEAVFLPALVHRVILNVRGEAEGIAVTDLLREVWEKTAVV